MAVEAIIQIRHRAMLARLAHLVETEAAEAEEHRPLGQVVPEPDAGDARG